MTSHDHAQPDTTAPAEPKVYGLLAEFEDVDSLMHAAKGVRHAGFTRWDCFTPFPVHGLNKAMGLRTTRLPLIVLVMGLTGATLGITLQLYTMATTLGFLPSWAQGYQFVISGKPYMSGPAYIPVTFELTILLSAFGAFFGMLGLNQLPKLYHPAFKSERFRRVTNDRFFIGVEADDAVYEDGKTLALLQSLGAVHVEELEE